MVSSPQFKVLRPKIVHCLLDAPGLFGTGVLVRLHHLAELVMMRAEK